MNKPVKIDVFYPLPVGWGMCTTCEAMMAQADMVKTPYDRSMDELPPEWQEDFIRLSAFIFNIADNFKDRVQIRIWDPRSLQGLWKSIRYGVRRYPTFVLNEHQKLFGWDQEKLENYIHEAEKHGI